jgi:hypothetical protein
MLDRGGPCARDALGGRRCTAPRERIHHGCGPWQRRDPTTRCWSPNIPTRHHRSRSRGVPRHGGFSRPTRSHPTRGTSPRHLGAYRLQSARPRQLYHPRPHSRSRGKLRHACRCHPRRTIFSRHSAVCPHAWPPAPLLPSPLRRGGPGERTPPAGGEVRAPPGIRRVLQDASSPGDFARPWPHRTPGSPLCPSVSSVPLCSP